MPILACPLCLLLIAGCQSSPTIRTMPVARHSTPAAPAPAKSTAKTPAPAKAPEKAPAKAPTKAESKKPKPAGSSAIPVVPTVDNSIKYSVQAIGADAKTRVELTPQADQLIVDIYSQSGKGALSLQLASGEMPRRIILRMHQQKFFSIRILADSILFYDLNTSTLNETQQVVLFGQPTYITPEHACWVDVTQGMVNNETVYQVSLPPVLIGHPKKGDKLGLVWTGYNEAPAAPAVPAPAVPAVPTVPAITPR